MPTRTPRRFQADRTPNHRYWYSGKLQTLNEVLCRRRLRQLQGTLIRNKRLGTPWSDDAEWRRVFTSGWSRRQHAIHMRKLGVFTRRGLNLRNPD